MASAKAPFGTMHNQPPPRQRKLADPAPWDKDPHGRAPLSSRSSGSSNTHNSNGSVGGGGGKSMSRAAAAKDHCQVGQSGGGGRRNGTHSSDKSAAMVPRRSTAAAAAAKVAGSTKTAPFGTAHNAPVAAHKNVAPSKAPWERDDTHRFQKIAFGNLKSFGAFIRT